MTTDKVEVPSIFDAELEPIQRLTKDLKEAAKLMSKAEVRYLVDSYYMMQGDRIRFANQNRAVLGQNEPATLLPWLTGQSQRFEMEIKKALDIWGQHQPVGVWCRSITGIGPVITAGLLAYIDIEKAHVAGAIWKYAGLDPSVKWEKGQKRPWNASLKTLCWKMGESFVKVSGNDKDIYGKLYLIRKDRDQKYNEAGKFVEEAAIKAKVVGKSTEAYKHYSTGKLPPGHIHARAKRYAVKIFISHLQHVMYLQHYKQQPPKPWAISHGGHVDMIPVPNLHLIEAKSAD